MQTVNCSSITYWHVVGCTALVLVVLSSMVGVETTVVVVTDLRVLVLVEVPDAMVRLGSVLGMS
jgi:hypothetical protein